MWTHSIGQVTVWIQFPMKYSWYPLLRGLGAVTFRQVRLGPNREGRHGASNHRHGMRFILSILVFFVEIYTNMPRTVLLVFCWFPHVVKSRVTVVTQLSPNKQPSTVGGTCDFGDGCLNFLNLMTRNSGMRGEETCSLEFTWAMHLEFSGCLLFLDPESNCWDVGIEKERIYLVTSVSQYCCWCRCGRFLTRQTVYQQIY